MVNIGPRGLDRPGFIGIDVGSVNSAKRAGVTRLPFRDCSLDYIFTEHFLRPMLAREALMLLRECRRVLKPGGRLGVAMPPASERGDAECCAWPAVGSVACPAAEGTPGFGYDAGDPEPDTIEDPWLCGERQLNQLADLAGLVELGISDCAASQIPEPAGVERSPQTQMIKEYSTRTGRTENAPAKVSVLIPAYRPDFVQEAIGSALEQAYENMEVIVCDDCPTDQIEAIVRNYQRSDSRVHYVKNDPKKGPLGNYVESFARATGEYFQFLNDDDVLGPGWIRMAAEVLSTDPGVSLVACARTHIDAAGHMLKDEDWISGRGRSRVFEGRSLIGYLGALGCNHIGEPSACMFRRADLATIRPHIMSVGGATVRGLGDFAMWVNLLSKGDLAYLASTRCKIRVHPDQWTHDPRLKSMAAQRWPRVRPHLARLGLYRGAFGRDQWPNLMVLLRGYRWRPIGSAGNWKAAPPRSIHVLVYSYRLVRAAFVLVGKRFGRSTEAT